MIAGIEHAMIPATPILPRLMPLSKPYKIFRSKVFLVMAQMYHVSTAIASESSLERLLYHSLNSCEVVITLSSQGAVGMPREPTLLIVYSDSAATPEYGLRRCVAPMPTRRDTCDAWSLRDPPHLRPAADRHSRALYHESIFQN
ncbi:jg2678 [Pararge aegeria aegeria]|uniref:Jg2678 protein n=1 Tax=Pararge aegeria aegeria TaxID=348720 RepID=A0A8S4R2K4_9NEOP|nr:jg2678 [Pararge aegeria aegeria]